MQNKLHIIKYCKYCKKTTNNNTYYCCNAHKSYFIQAFEWLGFVMS